MKKLNFCYNNKITYSKYKLVTLSLIILLVGTVQSKFTKGIFALQQTSNQEKSTNKNTDLTLINAVRENKLSQVKSILEKGSNVNAQDSEGRTPLMWATLLNNIEIAQALLDVDADTSIKDKQNYFAISYANTLRNDKMINLLRSTKDSSGRTTLMKVILNNQMSDVATLFSYGFNINEKDKKGYTSLMYATLADNKQMVQLLLSYRANVLDKNLEGHTALMLATGKGFTEIAKVIEDKIAENSSQRSKTLSFTTEDAPSKQTKQTSSVLPISPKTNYENEGLILVNTDQINNQTIFSIGVSDSISRNTILFSMEACINLVNVLDKTQPQDDFATGIKGLQEDVIYLAKVQESDYILIKLGITKLTLSLTEAKNFQKVLKNTLNK